MNSDLIKKIKEISLLDENIRCIIFTGSRLNNAVAKDGLEDFNLIVGLGELKLYMGLVNKLLIAEETIIKREERLSHHGYDLIHIRCLCEDESIIDLVLLDNANILDYIKDNSLVKNIADKDLILPEDKVISDIKFREEKISNKEFYDHVVNFYMKSVDVAISLARKEIIRANYLYDILKKDLLAIVNLYIGQKYDFNVNTGRLGKNFKVYLDKPYYEMYLEIFNTNDLDDFWKSLFVASSLFRKLSLEISRSLDYSYPKKEDVKTMEYLRRLNDKYNI